jgi:hypothetical protein
VPGVGRNVRLSAESRDCAYEAGHAEMREEKTCHKICWYEY